jgi:hypothetical protein
MEVALNIYIYIYIYNVFQLPKKPNSSLCRLARPAERGFETFILLVKHRRVNHSKAKQTYMYSIYIRNSDYSLVNDGSIMRGMNHEYKLL